jgi:hypothetical protein
MAEFLAFRNGNKTDEHGMLRLISQLTIGEVVNGLTTAPNGTPNMTVIVAPGTCLVPDTNYKYGAWIDANKTATITTADPSNPRIDSVVAYVDKSLVDTTNSNSPTGLKIAVVAGTPAGSPTAPSAGTIQTAVGASNPYIVLSQVRVNAGTTTITAPNITDTRFLVELAAGNTPVGTVLRDCVRTGGIITTVSGLTIAVSDIIYTVNKLRYRLSNISNITLTASKDNYIDITAGGTQLTVTNVTIGAAAPALAANSVRIGIVTTGAASITTINQLGFDSLGNMIYRTKRISGIVFADGTGGVTQFPHVGTMATFAAAASTFARTSFVVPDDIDTASNVVIRYRGYSTGATVSSGATNFVGAWDLGTDQAAASWNIALTNTLPAVTYTNNIFTEHTYTFSPTTPVALKPGMHMGTAFRFTSTANTMVLTSITFDYRPLSVI